MKEKVKPFHGNSFIWITAFILANFRGTVISDLLRQGLQLTNLRWIELSIWGVIVFSAIWTLYTEGLIREYRMSWKWNKVMVFFVFVILLSIFWSVFPLASVYRGLEFLCCTLVAAYLGTYYSLKELLDILFRFGTVLLIVSFVVAMFLPIIGVMSWEPYTGSWRGLFWHKNHFSGVVVLFNILFLINLLSSFRVDKNKFVVNTAFYLFSLVLVYLSKSAAGYIMALLLGGLVFVVYIWLKIRHKLRPIHYYGILGLVIFSLVVVIANLNFLLGLFGRDTTLTGRSGLWLYLVQDVIARSPWFGYGFGAVWSLNSFRISTQQILGWGFPVVIADNGFLDILLHVGWVGFVPFLGVLITALRRFYQYAIKRGNMLAFSPLFLLLFSFVANISFSFYAEVETFVWLVIVTMLFSVTKETRITVS